MPKFTKAERLLKSREFGAVYKRGDRRASSHFALAWRTSEKRRLGITVSSKIGKANVRNQIKRVIREYFRLNKESFPLGDVVLTARDGAGRLEPAKIRIELENLIKNA